MSDWANEKARELLPHNEYCEESYVPREMEAPDCACQWRPAVAEALREARRQALEERIAIAARKEGE